MFPTLKMRILVAVYVCALVILTWLYYFVNRRLRLSDHVNDRDDCLANVVTVNDGGRLANKIFEYASVWSVGKTYGFRPFVPTTIHRAVGDVFEQLSVPPLSELVEEIQHRQDGRCNAELNESTILKIEASGDELYPLDQYVKIMQAASKPIVLRRWIVLVDTIAPLMAELRRELRYRESYRQAAYESLDYIRRQMLRRSQRVGTTLILVGVHVRRQDYHQHLKRRFGVEIFAGVSYYLHAMAWMQSVLRAEAGGPIDVAFAVASDDAPWCRSVLIPAMHRSETPEVGSFGVFYAGNADSPGHDLALLSSCQHSIIAYGTFGTWAALMAGGRTAVYDIRANNERVRKKTSAMRFAEKMDKWMTLV